MNLFIFVTSAFLLLCASVAMVNGEETETESEVIEALEEESDDTKTWQEQLDDNYTNNK